MATQTADLRPQGKSAGRVVSRRWRRVALGVGLCLIVVGSWPAYRRAGYAYHLSAARADMERFDFDRALAALRRADVLQPDRAETQYLFAVVYRRKGVVDKVEPYLARARRLGWPKADLECQDLLMRAQIGRFEEVEAQLQTLLARDGIDDQTAVQVYEALANGYWRYRRIDDAHRALDFWIQWRPRDIAARLLKAQIYNEFSDRPAAEKEYRAILEFAPDHPLSHEMLGRFLLERGQVEDASKEFRLSLQGGPGSSSAISGLAECEFRLSHADEARKLLEQVDYASLEVEQRARVYKLKAELERYAGETAAAAKTLETAIAVWPHDSGIHQSLGQCYAALGQRELAEKHVEVAKSISERGERFFALKRQVVREPGNAELYFEIARILEAQGLTDEAANWWRSALRADRMHQASHEALASYYAALGKPELEARFRASARDALVVTFQRAWQALSRNEVPRAKSLDALLAGYPEVALHHELLQAAFQLKAGKPDDAARLLAKPLASPVLRPLALTIQAEALVSGGQPLAAEEPLREALRLAPDNVNAHRWLAVIDYDLGDVEQAEQHLLEVARLDPFDYRAPRLMGLMNKDYENFATAILHYGAALVRNPPREIRDEVLLELAECLVRQREYQKALQALNDATPSAARNVRLAECHYNLGNRDETLKLLDEVLAQAPDNFDALMLRGDLAMVAAEPAKAVESFEKAIAAQPFDHTAHFKLSQALARAGQKDASQRERQKSDELKELRSRFSKLHKDAIAQPRDVAIRREIAQLAEQLGRHDLAEVWTNAANVLEKAAAKQEK